MRLAVTDLVDHPGATREFRRVVEREELTDTDSWGPADEALASALDLDLHLDSVVEGILVRGTVSFSLDLPCARCTEPVRLDVSAQVAELFVDPVKADPDDEWDEGYELIDQRAAIDLSTLLRDVVVLDLPSRPVHADGLRPDGEPCAPPTIDGVEVRSEDEDATLRASTPDPRWAALADLELPEAN